MAYAPGIDYRGDQYAFQGISKLGDLFSGAIDKTEELRKQAALNDTIVQHALDNGLINQDEFNKYVQSPWAKKQGVANGIMANIHDDWQRKQFDAEQADKAAQRALQLQIAHMAHDPSANAFQPVYGPPPEQDPAYAGGPLEDMTPTGAPVSTKGPQVGITDERGTPHFYPWREVTGGTNPDGTVGQPVVDTTTLPGSRIITLPGSKQMKILPNPSQAVGSVLSGEGIPDNTFVMGAQGQPVKLDKATTRRLNAQQAPPEPTPAPFAAGARGYLPAWVPGSLATPPPVTPTPAPAVPDQTPIPTVVAPPIKVRVLNPDGKAFMIPSGRLQDYLDAGWTSG